MTTPTDKLKILFLCTGNSCRSQMAEGFARHLKGDCIEAFSAGTDPKGLAPLAVKVMAETGVDITGQTSDHVEKYLDLPLDVVVTVCGNAHETCPTFPGRVKVVHAGVEDPPHAGPEAIDDEQVLAVYRRVRDEIRAFIETLPELLTDKSD